ncbi:hypothetical protein CC86DRAFT_401084 [Ophiobolus disseminans]|uniref:Uncharacterized protein n=1 Tax=Ophiobolus disseminans TaxID=1469910 RepID=A0A6A7AGQ2_9PLEO|nr:hypothetical protein CC86DRAFT_401084 [Ophiobolus disseminans]
MKKDTIFSLVTIALLVVRKGFAEIRLELPELLLNSSHPAKEEDTPVPDYIEGIWPPEFPADDNMWKDFVCKGDNLMKAMQASDANAGQLFSSGLLSAQSVWMSSDALATWGWHLYRGDDSLKVNFLEDGDEPGHSLRAALAALGLPNMPSRDASIGLEVARVDHFDDHMSKPIDEQTYTVGEKVYRATGASLKITINTGVGAIIRLELKSPEFAGREDRTPPIDKSGMPGLQRASDIM